MTSKLIAGLALLAGFLVAWGCATGESDLGTAAGGSSATGATDGGGATGGLVAGGGFGPTGGVGAGVGGSAGAAGAGASAGASATGGIGATGGTASGGTSGTGGLGTGGVNTGGTTSTGGVSSGGTTGTGGTTNIIPTSCAQAHGSVGCCGSNGEIYYWECGKVSGGPGACNGNPCGWDAANGWYSCGGTGFTGSDPSGKYKRECGLPNPDPAGCSAPAGPCCGYCGSSITPTGCACDANCVLFGDCCSDACSVCGVC